LVAFFGGVVVEFFRYCLDEAYVVGGPVCYVLVLSQKCPFVWGLGLTLAKVYFGTAVYVGYLFEWVVGVCVVVTGYLCRWALDNDICSILQRNSPIARPTRDLNDLVLILVSRVVRSYVNGNLDPLNWRRQSPLPGIYRPSRLPLVLLIPRYPAKPPHHK
jgi:hypothetical protein